jgi:hypothetical protein
MTAAATLSPVATQFLSDFEGFLDTAMTTDRVIDMSKVMGSYKLKPADVEVIRAKLEPRSDEMEVVALGFDPELDEAYSNLSKEKKREILAMYHTVLGFEVKGKARKVKSTKLGTDGTFVDSASGAVAPVAKTPKAPKAPKVAEVKAPRVGGKFTAASPKAPAKNTPQDSADTLASAEQVMIGESPARINPRGAAIVSYLFKGPVSPVELSATLGMAYLPHSLILFSFAIVRPRGSSIRRRCRIK